MERVLILKMTLGRIYSAALYILSNDAAGAVNVESSWVDQQIFTVNDSAEVCSSPAVEEKQALCYIPVPPGS